MITRIIHILTDKGPPTPEIVDKIRYLGATLTSCSSFSFSAENDLRTFYRSANSILNVLNKPDELTLMHLLFTNCVPILTYACAVKDFSSREMSSCNTALNDAIRKIFSFNRWESVRHLREGCGYKSLYEIYRIPFKECQFCNKSDHDIVQC